jgi:ABC-type transporter Mla subunit MlaD
MSSSSTRDLVLGLAVVLSAVAVAAMMIWPEPEEARARWTTAFDEIGGLEAGAAVTYRGFRVGSVETIERVGVGQRFRVSFDLTVEAPPPESLVVELVRPVPIQPAALVLWDREPEGTVDRSPPGSRIPMICRGLPPAPEDCDISSCPSDLGFVGRMDEIVSEMRRFTEQAGVALAEVTKLAQHNLGPGSQLDTLLAGARKKTDEIDVESLNALLRNSAAVTRSAVVILEQNQAAIANLSRDLSGFVVSISSSTASLMQEVTDATRQMNELAAALQREPASLLGGRAMTDPPLVSGAGSDSR